MTNPKIFISYSRKNARFARQLYTRLQKLGYPLWRDRSQMLGGEDWWRQIKEAIAGSETLVLCMSPDALKSPVVQDEWLYARRLGKRVIPVIAEDVDFSALPRWMNRVDWVDFRPKRKLFGFDTKESDLAWKRFINQLNTSYTDSHRQMFNVDPLPDDFVPRPNEMNPLVDALVNQNEKVASITALRGAGGYGKTTIAIALCHDERVSLAFDDSIIWVTLGDKLSEADVMNRVRDILPLLTKEWQPFTTLEGAKNALRDAIADRYVLLVIDDLWNARDQTPFINVGKHAMTLVTTRNAGTLMGKGIQQNVDAMTPAEAVQLLSAGLYPRAKDEDGKYTGEWQIAPADKPALTAIAERLGE